MYVTEDQLVVTCTTCPIQHIIVMLHDQGLPVVMSWFLQIYLDQPVVGCIFVGSEYTHGPFVGYILFENYIGLNLFQKDLFS